eukprot:tig00021238_g19559.t1
MPGAGARGIPDVARLQLDGQHKFSAELQAALHAQTNVRMTHSSQPRIAPVAYVGGTPAPPLRDLVSLDMYSAEWNFDFGDGRRYSGTTDFKWRGTETPGHCVQPGITSCSLYQTLEFYDAVLHADEDTIKWREGGLHYLITYDPSLVWGLAVNFAVHGTCLPYAACRCDRRATEPPAKLVQLRDKWDAVLRRAKDDWRSVECMFEHTPFGCQNKGAGCPWQHTAGKRFAMP